MIAQWLIMIINYSHSHYYYSRYYPLIDDAYPIYLAVTITLWARLRTDFGAAARDRSEPERAAVTGIFAFKGRRKGSI